MTTFRVLEAVYKPGQQIGCFAKTLVRAGHFVKIVDTKTTVAAGGVETGCYQVGECGLGDAHFGVAERTSDAATEPAKSVQRMINVTRRGSIAKVIPGAAISYWQEVMPDAQGRAIPFVAGSAGGAASLDTGVVGSNNAITHTARRAGVGGNDLTVTFVDPGGTTATLSVDVANNGTDVIVNLGRAASAINSTAQNVIDAIQANGEADRLISVANKGASSGAGLVAAVSKTNLAGGVASTGAQAPAGRSVETKASDADFVEIDLY